MEAQKKITVTNFSSAVIHGILMCSQVFWRLVIFFVNVEQNLQSRLVV